MNSIVLQRLSPEGTQKNLALALGVSEATISRQKEYVEPMCSILAQLGLKLVPVEKQCIDPGELEFLRRAYARVSDVAPHILNEGDE